MIFAPLPLERSFLIEFDAKSDKRGFFARAFCANEFEKHGLDPKLVQANISYNKERGVLRGLHYQTVPHAEAKIFRCTRGAVYCVTVDLRNSSSTYLKWCGAELSADNRKCLYAPEGCATGYQALEDNSEVFYMTTQYYCPESEKGIRWDDPLFKIQWPLTEPILSPKDASCPDYQP